MAVKSSCYFCALTLKSVFKVESCSRILSMSDLTESIIWLLPLVDLDCFCSIPLSLLRWSCNFWFVYFFSSEISFLNSDFINSNSSTITSESWVRLYFMRVIYDLIWLVDLLTFFSVLFKHCCSFITSFWRRDRVCSSTWIFVRIVFALGALASFIVSCSGCLVPALALLF